MLVFFYEMNYGVGIILYYFVIDCIFVVCFYFCMWEFVVFIIEIFWEVLLVCVFLFVLLFIFS